MADWGVELTGTHFARVQPGGTEGFRLDIPSFKIDAGKAHPNRIPIMGPSGAGKSTFMNLLAGVVWPQGKSAKINWRFPDGFQCSWGDGGPDGNSAVTLRRRYFGYAYQTISLQPHLTLGENLSYPLEISGTSRQKAKEIAESRLALVFDGDTARARNFMSRYVTDVSGGERQRIALIQALIHDPFVLFADEPTGSLDQNTRRDVMGVLHNWLSERPDERLLLWVTHHADDPEENEVDVRIRVEESRCEWQKLAGGEWSAATQAAVA